MTSPTAPRANDRLAIAASSLLALSWLIPDVASGDFAFGPSDLGSLSPPALVASLAYPAAGALSMIALLLRALRSAAPWIVAVLSVLALALSMLLREPALPILGATALACTLAGAGLGVLLRKTPRKPLLAALALAALPLGVAIFSLIGVMTGEQRVEFLAPYREAACLWAVGALISVNVSSISGGFVRTMGR